MFFHFLINVGLIIKSASRSIRKSGFRVHVPSYKIISFFNNKDILLACLDFGFAIEIFFLLI